MESSMHRSRLVRSFAAAFALGAACCSLACAQPPIPPSAHRQIQEQVQALERSFASPPGDARPMMRWWWFGPAVAKPELSRELHVMQSAGIGGVEIQPVYPLALDDPERGIRNLFYLSPDFLDAVRFSNDTARSLGLRTDITLGSGWPYGGPGTTLALSAGRLKLVALPVSGSSIALPAPAAGDSLIAAFAASGTPQRWSSRGAMRIGTSVAGGSVTLPESSPGPRTLLLFYASHTGQRVKRAAVGAEGLVLDHFSRAAIDEHLHDVADRLASAFGDEPPTSVFSDSLEVYSSDWTAGLPAEFQRRRGYDLVARLPELYAGDSPESAAVRHDWGQTLSDFVRENYLQPIEAWSRAHNTLFRSQTYGDPAVTLADEAIPDLPEGEGPQWREFSYTRWATSAAHLYGRPVVSAETFTWLHSPVFRATPLDMKVEADRMFLSGVNQIVGHGWPYTPPGVPEPGWNLYAAAVFNDHNPWFPVMPDVARYLQRASWLLRQGKPANDVAILLPEDDAQAAFTPGHVSVTDEMKKLLAPQLMQSVLDAGYNIDFVDAATLDKLGVISYPIVVLPPADRLPLRTARLLAQYADGGGHIVAIGKLPSLAPGLAESGDSRSVAQTMQQLFHPGNAHAVHLPDERNLAQALHSALAPDLTSTSLPDPAAAGGDRNAGLGFIHRSLPGADIYFVANSSNQPLTTKLGFRAHRRGGVRLSLDTGQPVGELYGAAPYAATFAPYESAVFVFSDDPVRARQPYATPAKDAGAAPAHPSLVWRLSFAGEPPQPLSSFASWSTMPNRKFYSGEATYTAAFRLDALPGSADRVILDFGEGTPIADPRKPGSAGISALLNPPVRDAAIILVNGTRAGSLWHPPYDLDISSLLRIGSNTVEVRVYNTAVNMLAGQPPRDYTALNARYGKRFDPQDMDQIRPLPSGLLIAPTLRLEAASASSILHPRSTRHR
jgi:hypothetical protein